MSSSKTWRVEFRRSAYKEYSALPLQIRKRIDTALETLAVNPYSEIIQSRKIKGAGDHYRIRIGDYRIVYSLFQNILQIQIVRVGHRKDIYQYF